MNRNSYLLTAVAALLTACGGESTSNTAAPAAALTETAPLAVGKAGKANGVELTVTKVATPTGIGFGPKAKKGETFVVVSYMLKNTATEPLSLLSRPGFTLIDASGQSYNPDDFLTASAGIDIANQNSFVADINPNITVEGRAAWKVDAAAFDIGTWKVVAATDPALSFALK